jgi:hypothetical protein
MVAGCARGLIEKCSSRSQQLMSGLRPADLWSALGCTRGGRYLRKAHFHIVFHVAFFPYIRIPVR